MDTGKLIVKGNIYTTDLTDYSSISTVGGFSAFDTKSIWYKRVGNLVFVNFLIYGTSDQNTFTFTLPITAVLRTDSNLSIVLNNGSVITNAVCQLYMASGGTTVALYYAGSATGWATSNGKLGAGQFFYFC